VLVTHDGNIADQTPRRIEISDGRIVNSHVALPMEVIACGSATTSSPGSNGAAHKPS
jgi:hypothetical protein